jgi:O-antigen ligase
MLAIYLCFTRSIVIAIILAFIMSSLLMNYKKLFRYHKRMLIFLMAISFCTIFLFILFKIPLYRFSTVEISEEGTSDWIRWMAVKLTLKMFIESPLIGAGMGFFYPRDLSIEYISFEGYLIPRDPHNLYVLLLYEGGILGFALFIISIILLLIDIIYEIKLSKIGEEQLLKNALLINILIVLVYSFFSAYLAVGFRMSLLFWFLISLSLRRNYGKRKMRYCQFFGQ